MLYDQVQNNIDVEPVGRKATNTFYAGTLSQTLLAKYWLSDLDPGFQD